MTTSDVVVWLVRHGETRTYTHDDGLTRRGRHQAHVKGVELNHRIPSGAEVVLPHAPTARARETADALRGGLLTARAGRTRPDLPAPYPEPLFDNLRVWCDGRALDPTQAYAPYTRARDLPAEQRPPWFDDMDRFASIQAAGRDPITHWLTNPLLAFEPPGSAVLRFWRGIVDTAHDRPDVAHVVVSTHSGCIRALVAAAFGHDPGEPANTEAATVELTLDGLYASVSYRDQKADLAVPAVPTPTPW